MTPESQNRFWQLLCSFLVGITISATTFYFALGRNVITKEDLPAIFASQQSTIDDEKQSLKELQGSVTSLQIQLARISAQLGISGGTGVVEGDSRPVRSKERP